jgi:hypothetical protein
MGIETHEQRAKYPWGFKQQKYGSRTRLMVAIFRQKWRLNNIMIRQTHRLFLSNQHEDRQNLGHGFNHENSGFFIYF